MKTKDAKIGMVVNYYQRSYEDETILANSEKAVSLLRQDERIGSIILVDGSDESFQLIQEVCSKHQACYVHAGRELFFAEGYNIGWKLCNEPYIGLMANDILPQLGTMDVLLEWIEQPNVGCVFPYLTKSAYPTQIASNSRQNISCEPAAMTLNLNIFKRKILEAVGGVDEQFSGAFNDVILLLKIRKMGMRVVLAGDTCVEHIRFMTVKKIETNYNPREDKIKFKEQYSQYYSKTGFWNIAHWRDPFSVNFIMKACWWICHNLPSYRLRCRIEKYVFRLEPFLTKSKKINDKK